MQSDVKLQLARLTWPRASRLLTFMLVALVGTVVLALTLGSEHVPLSGMLSSALTREQSVILYEIRIPRIALAMATGAALAMAGAAFQALLRNPLADPYVLGVSSGAALGAVTGIVFFAGTGFFRPLLSFTGAGLATFLVYRLGRRGEEPARLILAGVVISTLLSSIIMLISSLVDNIQLRNITFWLLGDLSAGSQDSFWLLLAIVAVAGTALFLKSRALNLMMTGERDAFSLGVETSKVRWIVFTSASILTAAAVSAGGAIGFVGLVVPHLVRLSSSSDNRLVLPASGILGALFVVLADTAARTVIAPRELPTGAILALIGAPVLGYLLIGRRIGRIRVFEPEIKPPAPSNPPRRAVEGPVLALSSVSFSYDREVISELDLEINAGEVFALLGPNGAGKSTVLGVAAGYLTPSTGSVTLDRTPIESFSRREIARKLAVVAQAGELEFPMSVLEYVLTGRYAHAAGRGFDSGRDVDAALESLEAMDALHLTGRSFNHLSSGERQRVTVARALAQEPLALLLDEPTAHLDLAHQLTVLDLVRRMTREQKIGALLVTHEIHLARRFADRAALLKNGRIIASGIPSDILTGEALAELYSIPREFEDLI